MLLAAVRDGASPADVARAVALAAALRIAQFSTSNEHGDWESAHHTFSYAHAAFRLIERATNGADDPRAEADGLRAALHGALAVYHNRYLNVPPARLPRDEDLAGLPQATGDLRSAFLEACDRQQQVGPAAQLAARHLALGHPGTDLVATLGHALMREDASFHMVQNLEAAVQQYLAWQGQPEAAPILIAAARYLAAHTPTTRARHQTAWIARRLMKGGAVHEDLEPTDA
jgi:hypothetical protein